MTDAAAALSASPPEATATSPTRPSRLRGLSYLRSYTHLHSSPRSPLAPLVRAHTSPSSPTLGAPDPSTTAAYLSSTAQTPSRARRSSQADLSPSSNASTSAAQPVTTIGVSDASTKTRMTRNRAETYSAGMADRVGNDEAEGTTRSLLTGHEDSPAATAAEKRSQQPMIRLIPHQEARASRPSLTFPIMTRTVPSKTSIIRVGRYSEKDNQAVQTGNDGTSVQPVGFKSKVVSRRHCEFWCDDNQWYVRDVKSSSGTFLNHVRLSPANTESRPYPINDGDIVQLGIDFKGGEEVIFRCVKIRVECNRNWQKSLNQFNTSTHKQLRALASTTRKVSDAGSVSSSDCSICLNPVSPCQALFVAPCSHVWHYKCIRAIIYPKWPSFQCPNCRAYHDLEADVEPAEPDTEDDEDVLGMTEATEESTIEARVALERGATVADLNAEIDEPVDVSRATGTAPIAVPMPPAGATTAITSPDGPMTPRNDAGPFVLNSAVDGGLWNRRASGADNLARSPDPA